MPVKIIPKGSKYGRLTTTGRYEVRNNFSYFECICECGTIKWIKGKDLTYGSYKSCGCLQKEVARKPKTHGLSDSRIYKIYHAMKARCTYPKDKRYLRYGAKGITVCEEWLGENGFINFYVWSINNGYEDNLTIDRIDGTKGYSPSNCRWVTCQENLMNKSNTLFYEYNGNKKTLQDWAIESNIPYKRLRARIKECGWSFEKAINAPYKMNKNNKNRKEVI